MVENLLNDIKTQDKINAKIIDVLKQITEGDNEKLAQTDIFILFT